MSPSVLMRSVSDFAYSSNPDFWSRSATQARHNARSALHSVGIWTGLDARPMQSTRCGGNRSNPWRHSRRDNCGKGGRGFTNISNGSNLPPSDGASCCPGVAIWCRSSTGWRPVLVWWWRLAGAGTALASGRGLAAWWLIWWRGIRLAGFPTAARSRSRRRFNGFTVAGDVSICAVFPR